MNAPMLAPGNAAAVTAESLKQFTQESVQRFSNLCQEFFDRERQELLEKSPSTEDLEAHRTAIQRLLRSARAMLTMTSDPDFPDRGAVNELEGRLIQLQHSWRQSHEPMAEAEADEVLAKVFPE